MMKKSKKIGAVMLPGVLSMMVFSGNLEYWTSVVEKELAQVRGGN